MRASQVAYQEYLKSEHWLKLRQSVLERDKFLCKKCAGREKLQVHHKCYKSNWFLSVADDCITVCDACHWKQHHLPLEKRRYFTQHTKPPQREDAFIKCLELMEKRKAMGLPIYEDFRARFDDIRERIGSDIRDRVIALFR